MQRVIQLANRFIRCANGHGLVPAKIVRRLYHVSAGNQKVDLAPSPHGDTLESREAAAHGRPEV